MRKFWVLFVFVAMAFVSVKPPASVVIIGGGPVGLACAIEARQANASVTVVEKRCAYQRVQRLFLFDHTLQLLEKWGVVIPELCKIAVDDTYIGILKISLLEEALLKRAEELGVNVIQDEFVELSQNERSILLKDSGAIPYDILVAADGAHSCLRKALNIQLDLISQGKAGAALIPSSCEEFSLIGMSPDLQHGSSFIKKFYLPGMCLMFIQGPFSATKNDFIALCKASGWALEAEQIAEGKAHLLQNVDVNLQKAKTFSDQDQSALIVGDAAGTGSFLRGTGANYGLKTAEIAGHFFKTNDYEIFEAEMHAETNALIEDSAFLFSIK